MSDFELELLEKYRRRGILVDTNLMLLYFIGVFDTGLIPRFKRTQQFSLEDYELLALFLREFQKIVTTPNILTEVNSFMNQLSGKLKTLFYRKFAIELAQLEEIHTPSKDISQIVEFLQFGLTDTGILHTAKDKYLVLTDDLKLSAHATEFGVEAMNFYHLRDHF